MMTRGDNLPPLKRGGHIEAVAPCTFTPSPDAPKLTRAPHANRPSAPVTVRFSLSAGIPCVADNDPMGASPQGMAVRFHLAEHVHTDIIAHSHNGFPTRTGEEFLEFLSAATANGRGSPGPPPIAAFLASHPAAKAFVEAPKSIPTSYARQAYFAITAFKFTNASGQGRFGRFRIRPEAGTDFLTAEQAAKKTADFLAAELSARLMVVLSLSTAALCGMAVAPYAGKRTGESSLLRMLLDQFEPNDIVVGDRVCGNYLLLALGLHRRIDWLARIHQRRKIPAGRSRWIRCHEQRVTWQRPCRPWWMDRATYATIPKTLTLRQLTVDVQQPGFRVDRIQLVSTLLDRRQYPVWALADLYRARWNVELDLRAIKQSMAMDPLRSKTPDMIRKEIWAQWLAYNLIRKTIAQAALDAGRLPRQISFAGARQLVAASWDQLSREPQTVRKLAAVLWKAMAQHHVGHRPNRIEPRAVKRRPKKQPLLKTPRKEARAELLAGRKRG